MASSKDNKESEPPSKKRNKNEFRSLLELASRRELHHLIPAALSDSVVNARDNLGQTPLHLALLHGCSLETFNVLKRAGADIGEQDFQGHTALYFAIKGDCSNAVVNELLEYDWEMFFDERYIEAQKETFICALVMKRLNMLMPLIVKHHRILFDHTMTTNDQTLLCFALRFDSDDCPESIEPIIKLMSPASLNKTDENGNTYFHHATKEGCRSVTFRALLKAGLNPATKNNDGSNALHLLMLRCNTITYWNRTHLVLKELLRVRPELVEDRNHSNSLPIDLLVHLSFDIGRNAYNSNSVVCNTLKWVLLQNGPDFQWNRMSNRPFPTTDTARSFLRDCRSELELLRAFRVTDTLSLYDLVKTCYVSPKFVHELRVEKRFVRVLQFEAHLTVYEEEVREIVRMVRVCSSLYGKTLPFPVLKNGDYRNVSQRLLDYLSIDDLEKLAIAVNIA